MAVPKGEVRRAEPPHESSPSEIHFSTYLPFYAVDVGRWILWSEVIFLLLEFVFLCGAINP